MTNLQFRLFNTTAEFNTAVNGASLSVGDIVYDKEAKINYIITGTSSGKNTYISYYGKNAITGVSINNATVTLTFSDGTTSSQTVNNVANATSATKDGSGNIITDTYQPKIKIVDLT